MTRRPRYADVAATLALVLALGGTAYAAHSLPKHSVGKQQLRADAVTSKKIKNGRVRAADLAGGSVGTGQLQDNAVTGGKIANGSVDRADLAAGSVGGAELANGSVSLDELVGADVSTTVSYALAAGACAPVPLTVPGARAGQAGLLTLTGAGDPGDVVLGPLRVGNGGATLRACNVGASPAAVADLGVRVVTFG